MQGSSSLSSYIRLAEVGGRLETDQQIFSDVYVYMYAVRCLRYAGRDRRIFHSGVRDGETYLLS